MLMMIDFCHIACDKRWLGSLIKVLNNIVSDLLYNHMKVANMPAPLPLLI